MTGMRALELPKRATVNESAQIIRVCLDAEREPSALELDATRTETLGPFGAVLLASCVALRHRDGKETKLKLPEDSEDHPLVEAGLDRYVLGQELPQGAGILRPLERLDDAGVQQVAAEMAERDLDLTASAASSIRSCLVELLKNSFAWSDSSIGAMVLARWNKKNHAVRLAVLDRGVGIPAVLRRKQIHDLHRSPDPDVIVAATTIPNLTSDAGAASGDGLNTIHELVTGRHGRMTVVSLAAKVAWVGTKLTKSPSPPLRGTAVEIEIKPDEG